MATEVRIRRGTTAQHAGFTGAAAEITVDTDKDVVVVHDGVTAGGFPLARESGLGSKADSGANSDITSLSGLTTPLSVAQGGTAANTAAGARTALGAATAGALGSSGITGAAASGANSDITSLSGLTTPLSVAQGGTGSTGFGFAQVRQTVMSGPVDSSGLPAFGGSAGSTTVTMAGTLVATAANGFDSSGAVNAFGSGTNLSWTGLSTNGTMFLYVDIAGGVLTPGAGTLAPVYQRGGTYSTTSSQFTFNTVEMVGKVGNGSSAVQTNRVYVGEVTVAGGVVSAIIWYALNGEYDSGLFAVVANTTYSKNANIGSSADLFLFFSTTSTGLDGGGTTNEEVPYGGDGSGANANFRGCLFGQSTRNIVRARTQDLFQVLDSGGSSSNPSSGYVRLRAKRRF